jgi:hypothetical protein
LYCRKKARDRRRERKAYRLTAEQTVQMIYLCLCIREE